MNWIQKLLQKAKTLFSKYEDDAQILLIEENKKQQIESNNQELEVLNEIVIGTAEESIILNRIPELELNENWSVLSNDKSADFFSQVTGASAIAGSTMYASSGLYKATVSPEKLMVYNNGTTSSITLNGKSFSNHAGFVKAGAEVFTPLLAFQFTSFVTGQYYMNGINNQLQAIQKGITQLLTLHHNERIAKIKSITIKLIEFEKNNFFTPEDFVTLNNINMELSTIRYEYLLAAQQQLQSKLFPKKDGKNSSKKNNLSISNLSKAEELKIGTLKMLNELTAEFKALAENSGTTSFLGSVKSTFENSGNKVEELAKKINESEFFFFIKAALEAEKLLQYSQLIQLKANVSYKNPDENRIGKIRQLYKSICNYNSKNDSINSEVDYVLKTLKKELTTVINNYKENTILNKSNIVERERGIYSEFEEVENLTKNITELETERAKIKKAFENPVEFIFDNRDGDGKVYVKN